MTGSSDGPPRDNAHRFARRQNSAPASKLAVPGLVSNLEALAGELDAIQSRLERVRQAGRAAFADGTPSYDSASMAMIRLAALWEDSDRFLALLDQIEPVIVSGIKTTRNIIGHRGYRAMNDELFWRTITVDVPKLVARLREQHGLAV